MPAHPRKFFENLIHTRINYFVKNGSLTPPYTSNKNSSISSPILFNVYLRNIKAHVGPGVHLLQYADDLVIYSSSKFSIASFSIARGIPSHLLFSPFYTINPFLYHSLSDFLESFLIINFQVAFTLNIFYLRVVKLFLLCLLWHLFGRVLILNPF